MVVERWFFVFLLDGEGSEESDEKAVSLVEGDNGDAVSNQESAHKW